VEYHKIQTVWLRSPETKYKTLIEGAWALPEFECLRFAEWEFTEKIDGTNIRVSFHPQDEEPTFQGRTDRADIPKPLLKALQDTFVPQADKMREMFQDGAVLYGEGVGHGIGKMGKFYGEHRFILFDVRIGHWWLTREKLNAIANDLGIASAPLVGTGQLNDMIWQVRKGFKSQFGDFPAEGIVARPRVELQTLSGRRVITKLKLKDFPDEQRAVVFC
jgi:hypothetical protein